MERAAGWKSVRGEKKTFQAAMFGDARKFADLFAFSIVVEKPEYSHAENPECGQEEEPECGQEEEPECGQEEEPECGQEEEPECGCAARCAESLRLSGTLII